MDGEDAKGAKLVALSLLGLLAFNYPLLAVFNVDGTFYGVPILYAYLFAAWAVLIVLVARIADRGD